MSKVTTFWLWDLAWVYGAKTVKHYCRKSDSTWIGTCYVGESGGGCASRQTGSQSSLSGTAPGWDGAVPVGSEANLLNDTYQSADKSSPGGGQQHAQPQPLHGQPDADGVYDVRRKGIAVFYPVYLTEKDTMDIWCNGQKMETAGEFVEDGTETHFTLGNHDCCIKAVSSGKRRDGIIHTLLVDTTEIPECME
ncbi:unnamed protein product [Arctogadus glacialis]